MIFLQQITKTQQTDAVKLLFRHLQGYVEVIY